MNKLSSKKKLLPLPNLEGSAVKFPPKLAHASWKSSTKRGETVASLEKFRNPVNQRPVLLPVTTRLNILTPDSSVCERVYVNVPYVKVPPAEWPSSGAGG